MIAKVKTQEIVKKPSYWDKDKVYSFDEYFQLEEKALFKSEFRNGKIFPMPNGTTNHGKIIGSLFFQLKLATRTINQPTLVCTSEIKIFIETLNEGLYPDTFIVLQPEMYYKKDKAITNPSIIFEVLSDSTEGYDRGEKFRKYKHLYSFQEYVLIEQDQPVVDVFHKKDNSAWEMNSYIGLKEKMQLKTLDIQIGLSDIYEDIKDLHLPQYKMDL